MSELTPKEQALQLCYTFEAIGCGREVAAAIICVNEMLKIYNTILPPPGTTYSYPARYYWQQVKVELQKIEKDGYIKASNNE